MFGALPPVSSSAAPTSNFIKLINYDVDRDHHLYHDADDDDHVGK